ncbi:hypothetical protein [Stutzerimonas stutzeri]|uniref:hypothetical protein n=1 Tax=Stutzerimonas stutzeri TaxID=316 RepID=UPI003B7E79FB
MANATLSTLQSPTGKVRVKLQSLPATPKGFPKQRLCPSSKSVRANYGLRAPEVACAMAESLSYAYASLSEPAFAPMACGPFTERMLAQYVGRCLWSWDDVPAFIPPKRVPPLPIQPEAEDDTSTEAGADGDQQDGGEPPIYNPGEVSLYHCSRRLMQIAMRCTALFPEDMRSVSPRLSCNLLLGSYNSVDRAVARFLAGAGMEYDGQGLAAALAHVGYGEVQDGGLPPFHRLPERSKRTGYSVRQSLALDLAGPEGTLPLTHAILRSTLYEDDLAKRLIEVRDGVLERLRELAVEVRGVAPDVAQMIEDGDIPYEGAAERVVRGVWDLDLGVLDEGISTADPDDDLTALTCRMIISALGTGHAYIGATTLFALAALTGVSPAAYVRYAEKDLERRGVTYLTSSTVGELADLVAGADLEKESRRGVLIKELRLLEARLKPMEELLEKRGEKVKRLMRVRGWKVAEEWRGRKGADSDDE